MTTYWINLVECQRVVNDLDALLEDLRTDFDKVNGNAESIRESLCSAEESSQYEYKATQLDSAVDDFVTSDLTDHFNGIESALRAKVSAMQDVVNYYASGDAEMAHQAWGTTDQMPEYVYPGSGAAHNTTAGDGYVPGHPARGNTEHPTYVPGHPAQGLAGNDGGTGADGNLGDTYATQQPFVDAEAARD